MDLVLVAQLLQGGAGKVTTDNLIHLSGLEPAVNLLRGSRNRGLRPFRDHLEDLTEAFSLVRGVQVTSHYLRTVLNYDHVIPSRGKAALRSVEAPASSDCSGHAGDEAVDGLVGVVLKG